MHVEARSRFTIAAVAASASIVLSLMLGGACTFDRDSLRAERDGQAEAAGGQGGAGDGRVDVSQNSPADMMDVPADESVSETPTEPPVDAASSVDVKPETPCGSYDSCCGKPEGTDCGFDCETCVVGAGVCTAYYRCKAGKCVFDHEKKCTPMQVCGYPSGCMSPDGGAG